MRILFINVCSGRNSTGKIVSDLAKEEIEKGNDCVVAYGQSCYETGIKTIPVSNTFDIHMHALNSRLFDVAGFCSKHTTQKFLKWASEYNPDLLWLHNIHGYYINVEELFAWIKERPRLHVKWTLHDCWPFTGRCSYFTYNKCEKWKSGCGACAFPDVYPKRWLIDRSNLNYEKKKAVFAGVPNMTLITPSNWLVSLVKESFLSDYNVEVKYNKVNTEVFKYTESKFRHQYKIEDKILLLGVASIWDKRKGYEDLLALAKMLDKRFVLVIVGLLDKQQLKAINNAKIVHIQRADSAAQLAEIYSDADRYLNTNQKETFSMATLEAVTYGTRSIVYDTVASIEIAKECGGYVIQPGADHLYQALISLYGEQGGGNASIVTIERTSNVQRLVEIYSTADLLLNPTYEDNFPTVNLEAMACGTKVLTYRTGGSPETLVKR